MIFLRGCPLRCPNCHNRDLQTGSSLADIIITKKKLKVRWLDDGNHQGFGQTPAPKSQPSKSSQVTLECYGSIETSNNARLNEPDNVNWSDTVSAIVLSGGEPLHQPRAVRGLASMAKRIGLMVGIETCGFYPEALSSILKEGLLDMVFHDFKAAPDEAKYKIATGSEQALERALKSIDICMSYGIPMDIRVTVFPDYPTRKEIDEIACMVLDVTQRHLDNKLRALVLQQGISVDGKFQPVPIEELEAISLDLRERYPFEVMVKGSSSSPGEKAEEPGRPE